MTKKKKKKKRTNTHTNQMIYVPWLLDTICRGWERRRGDANEIPKGIYQFVCMLMLKLFAALPYIDLKIARKSNGLCTFSFKMKSNISKWLWGCFSLGEEWRNCEERSPDTSWTWFHHFKLLNTTPEPLTICRNSVILLGNCGNYPVFHQIFRMKCKCEQSNAIESLSRNWERATIKFRTKIKKLSISVFLLFLSFLTSDSLGFVWNDRICRRIILPKKKDLTEMTYYPRQQHKHILHFNSTLFFCMRTMFIADSTLYLFHTESILLFIEHRRRIKPSYKLDARIGRCEYVRSVSKNIVDGI